MKNIKERIIYVFNRLNLSKVLVIFVVGLISRVLINNFWNVNVFVDYLNSISLGYYGFMAIFVVLVHELFSYIDIKLLPKISMDVFSISSIRIGVSAIINNIGNKGKVTLSGDLGVDKVLDKSDKVKVTGVLLMGDKDGISSWFSSSFKGKPNRSGEIVPSAMQGLYGKSSKIRPSGLYENDYEVRRIKSVVDYKNLRRDIKTRSGFEGRKNKDILPRTNRVGVGGRTVPDVPAVPELDSRSVYELEGNSVDRKEHRYIPYRPKPVEGNSVGRKEHRYIPYRPKPDELDGNDKIKKKSLILDLHYLIMF